MKLQFTFENGGAEPVYVNIEPLPDRYLLKPGEQIKFYSEPDVNDHPPVIIWLPRGEITVWPNTAGNDLTLINGENAEVRSWSD